jgi:putative ABC transport system permease protein
MLQNFLLIAWRNLIKHKTFSLLNILGLTIGLACGILIFLYVQQQLSYDRFQPRADQVFRVNLRFARPGDQVQGGPYAPPGLAGALQEAIPEIKGVTRLLALNSEAQSVIQHQKNAFFEQNVFYADSNFHQVLSLTYLEGNPATALQQPASVVLTRATARKFLGKQSALGATLHINQQPFQVTGVVEDYPKASHLQFTALVSMVTTPGSRQDDWLANAYTTYVLLKKGASLSQVQKKIDRVTLTKLNPAFEQRFGKSYEQTIREGTVLSYYLQPLLAVHLHSAGLHDLLPRGNILYVYLFSLVGLFMLLLACFNYINLTTASSVQRAREVGIRKVLGAQKWELTEQFLAESLLVTIIAAGLALTLCQLVVRGFDGFFNAFLPVNTFPAEVLLLLGGVTFLVGIGSGLVPALFLTRYKPVAVLKGIVTKGDGGRRLRSVLVVLQFTVSIGLVAATLVVGEQMNYLKNKQLGYDKENLVVVANVDKLSDKQLLLKQMLQRESSLAALSLTFNELGTPSYSEAISPVGDTATRPADPVAVTSYVGDADFIATLDLQITMGTNFTVPLSGHNQQLMLNQEAVRKLGWKDRKASQIIGQTMDVNGRRYQVAAVVKDFHFRSLKESITPVIILSHHPYKVYDHLLVRIKANQVQAALKALESQWKQLAPSIPFSYAFLEDNLDQLYQGEQQMGSIFTVFSGLTILIACLGLLGLALSTTSQRAKEIGIRKVLGASVGGIVLLLAGSLIRWVFLASLMALPLCWYAMQQWLESFAYRTALEPATFVLALVLSLLVAWLTISLRTIAAARANPVDSLRQE